jgi:glycosyltransferase
MKLSVVSVSLNAERTIGLTIESFLRQDHPDKELLILDGCSRDRTVEIARSFKSSQIRIWSEKDGGIYDAMNKGLALFTGEAVGFIGADDTFHDGNALSLVAEALEGADIVYGDLNMVRDHTGKEVVRFWKSGQYHNRSFARGWMPPHPTFYVRRHVVETVGRFDLSYSVSSDYDFMLRAMVNSPYRIGYIPRVLVDFQLGGVSSRSMSGILRQNLECLDSRKRHLGASFVDAAFFLKWARKLPQFWFGND